MNNMILSNSLTTKLAY